MSDNNQKLNQEIDAGKFFLTLIYIFLSIGGVFFLIWFFRDVYNLQEVKYINDSRYAFRIIESEVASLYEKQNYIFDEKLKKDDSFCQHLINNYSKGANGSCMNFNPMTPSENFTFKGKNITIYGLEKDPFPMNGSIVKDIIIDVNGENKGENQVGIDRTIIRIYSSGRVAGVVTPVNCSSEDEKNYGLKKSVYCIGSQEMNYMVTNKPLGFDIMQKNTETGKIRQIGSNMPFLRLDCTAFDSNITGAEDYCEEKMFYSISGCEDEYECSARISK